MSYANPDLHCHSRVSDGTLEPEALAARARANGVDLWALTDHDEIGGQHRARDAAKAAGVAYVTGVEISVSFLGETVHIVGLGFDPDNAALQAGLENTRGGRTRRAHDMADDLARVGIAGAFEGALRWAGNPDLISRTHFARHLVEQGVCADTNEVFRRYLVEGKPGFVPHRWAALTDALQWITGAGGLPVIAHPGRYHFDALQEHALFEAFRAHGGVGVEVITGSHSSADARKYTDLALNLGMAASRGSDFHSPEESRIDLGGLPPLSPQLTAVWELLGERVHCP